MRRHGAAALLTLALTACTGGGGGGPTPTPQPPATPEYTRTLLDTLSVPAGCHLTNRSRVTVNTYHVMPAQFVADGRGGAVLGLSCAESSGQVLRAVYRANAAGVNMVGEVPSGMTAFGVNGAGVYYTGSQLDFKSPLAYVTAQGQRLGAPYVYDPDITALFLANNSGISRVNEDGSVMGWHTFTKLYDDELDEPRGGYVWTWRPGQAARQVQGDTSLPESGWPPFLWTAPGQPGSGEQIQYQRHENTVALRGQIQKPDGSLVDLPVKPIEEIEPSAERWTPGGYVVTYAKKINGAAVYTGYYLWRDGARIDRTGVLETVAADGDAVVALGGRMILRRPSGEEFVLPGVDRGGSADGVQYVAAGGGIAYAVAEGRVYRFAPPALSPGGSVTLGAVTPADQLAADPLPGAGARATRRADGSHLSVKLSAPVAGHQRTLLLTLHGSLAAGQTFTLGGASGDQITGATFIDIRTSPVKVNTLFARSGTVTLDGWTGRSAKLTLRDVVLGGSAGQSVTLSGTLTLPEVELE